MPKFCVRYYKLETSRVRYEIDVEAADAAAARQRVLDCYEGVDDFTEEEWGSETTGKEELVDSEFYALEDEDAPFAVMELVQ